MARSDLKILIPPWSLTGIVLLFWGVATGNLLIAGVLAFLLEGRRWIPLKWNFGEEAQLKAFYFSMLLMAAAVALSWMDDESGPASLIVMRWFPLIFLPLEFAQRYGGRNYVTLNTFFFVTKRRLDLDREEGREVDPIELNTGYVYILLSLIAACSGVEENQNYWFWLCAMVFLVLLSVSRMRGMKPKGLLMVMPFVIALGWGGQWVLNSAHQWVERYMQGRYTGQGSSNDHLSFMTQVSELGNVKLHPRIEWRVWADQSPNYLRLGNYNNYNQGRWTYSYTQEGFDGWNESFDSHEHYLTQLEFGKTTYFRSSDAASVAKLNRADGALIRGTIAHKNAVAVVPTIDHYIAVSDIPGTVTNAEINSMGTMQLVERGPVINFRLYTDSNTKSQDVGPVDGIDLKIPETEQEVIAELAEKLGLKQMKSDAEVITAITRYFNEEFSYSTDFDPGEQDHEISKLEWFLRDVKCGHCEYYATATTLLLRECGIPARYTVGYSVNERDGDHWNVRGRNAHAWTRAYVNGEWQVVDATPPDLRGGAIAEMNAVDWVKEKINMIREDFFIWRQNPENKSKLILRVSIATGILILWIAFRLWQHRAKGVAVETLANSWSGESVKTPLHSLSRELTRSVGARRSGELFSVWLSRASELEHVDVELLTRALEQHQQMRFDPEAEDASAELVVMAKTLKQQMRKR